VTIVVEKSSQSNNLKGIDNEGENMPTILITSMGGSGSMNLVDTIRIYDKERRYRIIGTHCDSFELAKSDLKDLFIVPKAADEEAYIKAHCEIIEFHNVDLLIANSDKEVTTCSKHVERLKCKHLIPDAKLVEAVQDKFQLNRILYRHGNPTITNIQISSREGVREAVSALPPCDKFWIRLCQGSGSVAATWLKTAEQAEKWIDLWSELRGFKIEEFIIAPFLPGRDFCVALLFKQGDLVVGKIYERLDYMVGGVTLSGMGSSPNISRTVEEREAIDTCIKAVRAICDEFGVTPHGYYQLDMKCDSNDISYVTEINIGRFPMTSPQFDRVGAYNMLELYIQMILHPETPLPKSVYDFDPGIYILRSIDAPVKFVKRERVQEINDHSV